MPNSMHGEAAMKPAKTPKDAAMSDALTIARHRVEALAAPIGWHDTKESRRARAARAIGTTVRRVRAILAGEKLRLSADEYFAIERAWERAHVAVASISRMARHADVSLGRANGRNGKAGDGEGRRPVSPARRGSAKETAGD
jgi:hypothetical protein